MKDYKRFVWNNIEDTTWMITNEKIDLLCNPIFHNIMNTMYNFKMSLNNKIILK